MPSPLFAGALAFAFVSAPRDGAPVRTPVAVPGIEAPALAAIAAAAGFGAVPARLPLLSYDADSIVVEKAARTLTLYRRGLPVRAYYVALGGNPVGDKVRAGDRRTPEGLFRIEARNPKSQYHLAVRVSYPSAAHRKRAAALGVSPGGDIMVHGLPPAFASYGRDHRQTDWTEGCIALSNEEIEEVYRSVPVGAPIEIKP